MPHPSAPASRGGAGLADRVTGCQPPSGGPVLSPGTVVEWDPAGLGPDPSGEPTAFPVAGRPREPIAPGSLTIPEAPLYIGLAEATHHRAPSPSGVLPRT